MPAHLPACRPARPTTHQTARVGYAEDESIGFQPAVRAAACQCARAFAPPPRHPSSPTPAAHRAPLLLRPAAARAGATARATLLPLAAAATVPLHGVITPDPPRRQRYAAATPLQRRRRRRPQRASREGLPTAPPLSTRAAAVASPPHAARASATAARGRTIGGGGADSGVCHPPGYCQPSADTARCAPDAAAAADGRAGRSVASQPRLLREWAHAVAPPLLPAVTLPARLRAADSCAPPTTARRCSHRTPCATGWSAPTAAAISCQHSPVGGSVAPPRCRQHPRRRRALSRLAATGEGVAGAARGPTPVTGCRAARWAARFSYLSPHVRRRGAGVAPPPTPHAAVGPCRLDTVSKRNTLWFGSSCLVYRRVLQLDTVLAVTGSRMRARTHGRLSTLPSVRLDCWLDQRKNLCSHNIVVMPTAGRERRSAGT